MLLRRSAQSQVRCEFIGHATFVRAELLAKKTLLLPWLSSVSVWI